MSLPPLPTQQGGITIEASAVLVNLKKHNNCLPQKIIVCEFVRYDADWLVRRLDKNRIGHIFALMGYITGSPMHLQAAVSTLFNLFDHKLVKPSH